MVRRPSEAPYTAAAKPAGPAPTTTVSYSARSGSVPRLSSSATRRSCGLTTVLPPITWIAGQSSAPGSAPTHHALDAVVALDRLDTTVEHREQRAVVALVRGVLARRERDVGGHGAELLALSSVQVGEDRDLGELLGSHHFQVLLARPSGAS